MLNTPGINLLAKRMPFNVEFTNVITVWLPPSVAADTDGDEFTLSIAVELPVFLVLPNGVDTYEHVVVVKGVVEKLTVYQDCVKYYYGDHFSQDHRLRYMVLRRSEAQDQIKECPQSDRKYVENMRSVVRFTRLVRIRNRDQFVLHQLRPHCEVLMEACNRILEAERSTYYCMAWTYPYRISFLSIGVFWVSLYKGGERKEAFPYMGNASRLALNPPSPAVPDDFEKVTTAVGGQDAYPDWWLYYCKAATHHGQQNHREAVLEAVIALEMALSSFARKKWKQQGVSNNAVDRAKRDVTLSMMINIELMALAEPGNKPSLELIGQLNKARKLRNDIVHEGKIEVSETEAGGCLDCIREALLFMSPDIYDGQLMESIVATEAKPKEATGPE